MYQPGCVNSGPRVDQDLNQIQYRNVPIRSALPIRIAPKWACKLSQNSSTPHKIEAPGSSNKNVTESIHKYIVNAWHMLFKITMAATATGFNVSVTNYKRPYDAEMARNRSALGSVLAPASSNRDITVFNVSCCQPEQVIK